MATEIKMPQLGETVVEGTITKWLKQEGEEVSADELLVEVSTDKVDSEVPSSASGVLQKILVPEGETVSVGTPIALVGEAGEAPADEGGGEEAPDEEEQPQQEAPKEEEPQQEERSEQEQQDQPAAEQRTPPPPPPPSQQQPAAQGGGQQAAEAPKQEQPAAEAQPAGDTSKRGIISPLVRRLAEEHGVDLDQVQGTGTGGRIKKQDVLQFVEQGKAQPEKPAAAQQPAPAERPSEKPAAEPEAAPAGEREEVVPWTNIRRRTAEHMVASSLETARAWNAVEADWTNIVALRGKAKKRFQEVEGFNLTFMPFLARALCETLREMPEVNATFAEEQQANIVKHYVNLGIAVALEGGGLIVPVIKNADEKNLVGVARSINDLASRARNKKLVPDDLVGGTFTITNPGPFGSKLSVPIIPRGQTAILAFEAIEKRVVVTKDDAIAIRSMGFLPMSWDHRTIDGAEAARFLARLRERIETTDFSGELGHYL